MPRKSLTPAKRAGMVGFPNYRSRNRRLALVEQGAKVLFSTAWSTRAFVGVEYGHNGGVIASSNRKVWRLSIGRGALFAPPFFITQTIEVSHV